MATSPANVTDSNSYTFIDGFNTTSATYTNGGVGASLIALSDSAWDHSDATAAHPYLVSTAGELIAAASSADTEVAEMPVSATNNNFYIELGNLAANEQIRFYFKKTSGNTANNDSTFDAHSIYFKNTGGTLQTRIITLEGGVVNTDIDSGFSSTVDDGTAYLVAGDATRIPALINYTEDRITLNIQNQTRTLALSASDGLIGNSYIGVTFRSNSGGGGTGKIYDIRAW